MTKYDKVKEAFEQAEKVAGAPRSAPPHPQNSGKNHPPVNPNEILDIEEKCSVLPLNDTGNGRRFILHFSKDVIYVSRVGWHIWDDTCWAKDENKIEVQKLGQLISQKIEDELKHLTHTESEMFYVDQLDFAKDRMAVLAAMSAKERTADQRREYNEMSDLLATIEEIKGRLKKRHGQHINFARASGNSSPIKNLLNEASVHLARDIEEMDREALDVNCANGTLRFKVDQNGQSKKASFVLEPHKRSDLITKCIAAEYHKEDTCPRFEAFLEEVQPDPEMRKFLQRSLGLAMTGLQEQHLWFLHGGGANGKSVLMDLIARVLGEYSATAKIESFTGQAKRGGSDATPDLIPLIGSRMVRASEPDANERLKEGTVKELTGGEPFLVRPLHGEFIEVHPHFKLFISGNHKPDIRGTDDGIWRRVLLVPFEVQIPKDRRNPKLVEELTEEVSGILNWLVSGLIDYLENGLCIPKKVLEATNDYREDSDPIGAFLRHCCEITGADEDRIDATPLAKAFQFWLSSNGNSEWRSLTQVQRQLKSASSSYVCAETKKTFANVKASTSRYVGIRFKPEFKARLEQDTGDYQPDQLPDDFQDF